MAKFSFRRHSDPIFVLALKDAVVKISSQKQCPNEGRIVRCVQQEFDWSKAEILKQLKFAVKDGLIYQVTTFSSHGSTKGMPQTAYRILRKDDEDKVRCGIISCSHVIFWRAMLRKWSPLQIALLVVYMFLMLRFSIF